MSFLSGGNWTSDPRERSDQELVEHRRATRGDRLAEATLACPGCDAPIALHGARIAVTAPLTCPFCGHRDAARAFLSLSVPTRPTRVVLRVGFGGRR